MSASRSPDTNPQLKRLKTLVIAGPLLVVSSIILYKRLYKGEEQRKLPRPDDPYAARTSLFQQVQKDQINEVENARHPRT